MVSFESVYIRVHNAELSLSVHPVVLIGKHPITKLIIHSEYLSLLHASPTLFSSSLLICFHIIGGWKIVHSITRGCIICRCQSARPSPQIMGTLPIEHVTPGPVFDKTGVDFAGPLLIKYSHVRKPAIVKAYICVYVA